MNAERYVATFDSDRPERGVVVDEEQGRYCTFPSLERAQTAADRWNQPPLWDADPPMIWRSVETGERLHPYPAVSDHSIAGNVTDRAIHDTSQSHTNRTQEEQ